VNASPDVLVAGAGPAGAAVAIGLTRLGYRVGVLAVPRPFVSCEGVSARVREGLGNAGLLHAAAAVPSPSPRRAIWAGTERTAGAESLLWREGFDRALREDLDAAGVGCESGRLRSCRPVPGGGVEAVLSDGSRRLAAALVDARGRAAFERRQCALQGPPTVAVSQCWRGTPGEVGSLVFAFDEGWAWCTRLPDGTRFTQIFLASDALTLPARPALGGWLHERLLALPLAREWVAGCRAVAAPVARACTAWLHARPWESGVLRAGDAAMAVDPLSGNGIFQALSSASVAPAVINTLLQDPANATLAADFYSARLRELFLRFARAGRDFYAEEAPGSGSPFWHVRARWPDAEPMHASEDRVLGVEVRPVVEEGWIRAREVAITTAQPLGVWRVAGEDIVAWLRVPAPSRAARLLEAIPDPRRRQILSDWLAHHGELPDTGDGPRRSMP
jgi:flavin-dependent dehydrogenase